MKEQSSPTWINKFLWQSIKKTNIFYRLLVLGFSSFITFCLILLVKSLEINIFVKVVAYIYCIFNALFYMPTLMTTFAEKKNGSFGLLIISKILLMFPFISTPIGFLYLILCSNNKKSG